MINAKLDGVARTMLMTLRARAEEQEQDKPLLDDKWSVDWYKHLPKYDEFDEWYNPPFQLATVIRSVLIDKMAQDFIDSHDKPLVVELGAGLSTRYFRIGQEKTRWIELDLMDAIAVRHKLDFAVADHWFISADFTESMAWLDELLDDKGKDVLFIAEGVLMFTSQEQVEALFDTLKDRFKGATIIFDVINPSYLERVTEQFKEMKAPMQWGMDAKKVKSLGVKVEDTAYLLTEYPERWDTIEVDKKHRTEDRSGFVVRGVLK